MHQQIRGRGRNISICKKKGGRFYRTFAESWDIYTMAPGKGEGDKGSLGGVHVLRAKGGPSERRKKMIHASRV